MGLERYKRDMECCTRCGFCKVIFGPMQKSWRFNAACPIHKRYGFDAYSAQGMLDIAYAVLTEGRMESKKLTEIVFSCTTCGYCDYACKWVHANAEVLDIILELRAQLVNRGIAPSLHKQLVENVAKNNNIYGKPHNRRFDWMQEEITPSKKASIVYFVGCTTSYLKPEIAQATLKILKAAGVDFILLGPEEYCCGAILWRTGQTDAAKRLMEHNVEAIRKSGANILLLSCAHCYGTFKREYPKVSGPLGFEVLHISELIKNLIEEGRIKLTKRINMKVTYHDPCLLGRLGEKYIPWDGKVKMFGLHEPPKSWLFGSKGVYAPPREILKTIPGLELVEMERIREYAWCCGGGFMEASPDLALWTAKERLEEVKSVAAEAVVSCCPHCAINFEKAIADRRENIGYYDLVQLVAMSLG